MTKINIHTKNSELNLQKGKYFIFFTGGHSVTIYNKFKIIIQDKKTNLKIGLFTTWIATGYENGQRTAKYYEFEIKENGIYSIDIEHPEQLIIKKSKLNLKNLFYSLISKDGVSVKESEKNILIRKQIY